MLHLFRQNAFRLGSGLTFALLLLALFIANPAQAAQPNDSLSGSKNTSISYVEDSSNATVTLVSAASGRATSLYRFILSVSTADTVYFRCGSTQKTAKLYLGANSGLESNLFPFYIRCNNNEALSVVKGTASTPLGITFWYNLEP